MARKKKSTSLVNNFLGSYEVRLDLSNFRFVLPSEFRGLIKDEVIITKGFNNTLLIIPVEKWHQLIEPLNTNPLFGQTNRELLRYIAGNSYKVAVGKQGRIVIPSFLRDSELKESSKLVLVGMIDYIEIWPVQRWLQKQKDLARNVDKLAGRLINEKL